MKSESLYSHLLEIGLSKEEARMYIALLKAGETTAGPLIKKTGFHRQVAYDTLDKLVDRELAFVTVKKNRKHWSADNPQVLEKELARKKALVHEILPELLSLKNLSRHEQEVHIYEGEKGLAQMHMSNTHEAFKESANFIIGSSPLLFARAMKKQKKFETFEQLRLQKRIRIKLLFPESERKNAEHIVKTHFQDQPQGLQREYRYLPERQNSPVAIHIWQDRVVFVTYGSPILSIVIKNKFLAKDFFRYFDYLWTLAKK